MPAARRAPLVALLTVLQRRFPGLDDPARLIKDGAVLVNGVPAESPRTRVRADAAIRIRHPACCAGRSSWPTPWPPSRSTRPAPSRSTWARQPEASPRPCSMPGQPASTPSTPAPASSAAGYAPTPG